MNGKKFSELQKMSPVELLHEIQNRRKNKQNNIITDDKFEQFLVELWKDFFPNIDFNIHSDFFFLGGTSLQAVIMLSKIKNTYNVEFDLVELFQATTIESQANLIKHTLFNGKVNKKNFIYQNDIDLVKQIDLVNTKPVSNKVNTILLTGVSGFLGLHLLKEFLVKTDAIIFCMIRAASKEEGIHRLLQKAKDYKIDITLSEQKKIQCFCGDVSQQQLGLSEDDYHYVTEHSDLIIHSAALVNFIYPYELLRKTNVVSLFELMKIASTNQLKPIHLISTIGVFMNQFDTLIEVNEYTALSEASHLNGYFQSKWVSEKMSMLAKEKGLPISIYRPSGITLHSKSGIISAEDLSCQLMKLSIKLGAFADLKSIIDVLPVDYVAGAISDLVINLPFESNIYHLTSGETLSSTEFIKQLPQSKSIKILPYDEYIKQATKLVDTSDDEQLRKLGPLLLSSLVASSNSVGNLPVFNSKFTDSLLNRRKKPHLRDTILSILKTARD